MVKRVCVTALSLIMAAACATSDVPREACAEGDMATLGEVFGRHQAVLVGETHGTNEMPAAFAEIVTQAAATGARILVALEYRTEWQPDVDRIMDAADEASARAILKGLTTGDGRTSDAMRDMVVSLRALKQGGADIHVRAVDYWRTEGREPPALPTNLPPEINAEGSTRDIIMGETAVQACADVSCDLLLYFAGNLHTRLDVSEGGAFNVETGEVTTYMIAPAGYMIARSMDTASVYLSHRGGVAKATTRHGQGGFVMKANTPDYVAEDDVLYCTRPGAPHPYVMSVGPITPSEDTASKP